jgi:hypothetical protein
VENISEGLVSLLIEDLCLWKSLWCSGQPGWREMGESWGETGQLWMGGEVVKEVGMQDGL